MIMMGFGIGVLFMVSLKYNAKLLIWLMILGLLTVMITGAILTGI